MSIVENGEEPRRCRGRPQLRTDEETEAVIVEAAVTLFRADGYAGTSMAAVAQQAGVSTKTLYRLIPTKAELFQRVVAGRIGRFILELGDIEGPSQDLAADLERLLITYANLVLEPETLPIYRLVVSESARFPELGKTFYEDAIRRTETTLATWLDRRCQAGQIRLHDPREAAGMLRGMMIMEPQRAALLGQAPAPDSTQIADRARRCAALFLEGCVVRQP